MAWLWSITHQRGGSRCSQALHRLGRRDEGEGRCRARRARGCEHTPLGVAGPLAFTGDWDLGQSI